MDLNELAIHMIDVREKLDEAKKVSSELQKEWDKLRKELIPEKMDEMGIDSVRLKGIGTISLRADAYASVKSGHAQDLQEWLRSHDHAELVVSTVNSSTLKAFLKEQVREGEPIPDDYVNFTPYTYATITGKG